MKTQWQFQNLTLQKTLEEVAQESTAILPIITLPLRQESLVYPPLPATPLLVGEVITPDPCVDGENAEADPLLALEASAPTKAVVTRKKKFLRGTALVLCLLLALVLFFTWHTITSASAAPTITQQNLSNTASPSASPSTTDNTSSNGSTSGTIQAYILGAVVHAGVYTLPADARVYQLLQAAGGPLPDADLVALNLAAKLSDGEEIYVLKVGEVPPSNVSSSNPGGGSPGTPTTGQLVNINTATETQMVQALHISAATAKKIIDYRTQHGPYTSVDQLSQVVSQTIYNRIKPLVTV